MSWKKLQQVAAMTTLSIVSLAGMVSESSAQPRYNQNYRHRQSQTYRTIEGTVTNDRKGRNFTVRTLNGQWVQVRLTRDEPRRLDEGDRVRVYGYFQGNHFVGTSLSILTNTTQNDNRNHVTVTGVVTDVQSDRLRVRSGSRLYTVYSNNGWPSNLDEGDRVRVVGRLSGSTLTSSNIVVLDNNGTQGTAINFNGTVLNVVGNSNRVSVRADNGRTYNIQGRDNDVDNLSRGDRVHVQGHYERGMVYADDIDEL
jgi:membrane protein implicated in regulation of membrane protease activity